MIKYNFKVEVPFLDKTNNLKEVKKDSVLKVTEERLQELNKAEVGRVISAEYEEEKATTKVTKTKNKKDEEITTPKSDEEKEKTEDSKTDETEKTEEINPEEKEPIENTDNK